MGHDFFDDVAPSTIFLAPVAIDATGMLVRGDGISKIDFLGVRRALRRVFCSRGLRAGPAKAQRERYDAAMHVTTLNPAAAKMLGRQVGLCR